MLGEEFEDCPFSGRNTSPLFLAGDMSKLCAPRPLEFDGPEVMLVHGPKDVRAQCNLSAESKLVFKVGHLKPTEFVVGEADLLIVNFRLRTSLTLILITMTGRATMTRFSYLTT